MHTFPIAMATAELLTFLSKETVEFSSPYITGRSPLESGDAAMRDESNESVKSTRSSSSMSSLKTEDCKASQLLSTAIHSCYLHSPIV